ncbi:hypothetical protein [Blastopirellula marina]|uniref:Uncharacterized protein n=1 Tax=Blastopirellula marina TaxID=124 RepID=A0A2S8GTF4_9BACT|nr:hypothetical protein [Blastopirellula marina]PQO47690.1 hypothetical protein C5Y93_03275 [Blastopirellula marina]
MNLERYQYFTRAEILACFVDPQPLDETGWHLSSNRLIGLFAVGRRPPEIHFCNNNSFHWYGEPCAALREKFEKFRELDGGHLFIKSPASDRYAYVADITHLGMYGGGPDRQEACMDIAPQVPSALLQELGGLYLHPEGDAAMNRAVAALRAAKTADERFAAFQPFVEFWRGPVEKSQGLSESRLAKSPLPIPAILAQLYRWAGDCDDVMSAGYLSICKPSKLAADKEGFVPFCIECQWCGNYFLRADAMQQDDPEVYSDECGEPNFHATGIRVSQFLWAYFIMYHAPNGPISYFANVEPDEFQQLKQWLNPLPVLAPGSQACRGIQAYNPEVSSDDEAHVFALDGIMGSLTQDPYARQITFAGKTEAAVESFIARLPFERDRLQDAY